MDSVYFGNCTIWGSGEGKGPWVMADMEDGIVSGKGHQAEPEPRKLALRIRHRHGEEQRDHRVRDQRRGCNDSHPEDLLPRRAARREKPHEKAGRRRARERRGLLLQQQQRERGDLYEGAIVAGYPSDATDNAIHANIVEAGYGE